MERESIDQAARSASDLIQRTIELLAAGPTISVAELLLENVQDELSKIGRESAFFEKQGLPLQEAWVGVQFGNAMKFNAIMLAPKAQIGFDVILFKDGLPHKFDISEATDRTIDRAEKYRTGPKTVLEDDREISRQEDLFEKSVGNRLKRKSTQDLVVYVNTGWLPDDEFVEKLLVRWHQSFKNRFESAYLLLRGGVVQIAPELREISNWRSDRNRTDAGG